MPKEWTELKVGDKVVQRGCGGRKVESVDCPGVVLTIKKFHPQRALAGSFLLSEKGIVEFEEGQQSYDGFTNFTSDFVLAEERLTEIQGNIKRLTAEADRIKKALG